MKNAPMSAADLAAIRKLAEASTPDVVVGLFRSEDPADQVAQFKETLDFGTGKVWCLCCPVDGKPIEDEALYAAITGNGPTSEANARFYSVARRAVLDLLGHIAALGEESKAWHDECREAEQQRDTLAAKLAEAQRERDEARQEAQALHVVEEETDEALAEAERDVQALLRATARIRELTSERDELLRLRGPCALAEQMTRVELVESRARAIAERDAALAEQRRLAAEVERMRPVVEAAIAWDRYRRGLSGLGGPGLIDAVEEYLRAAPQPTAVDREASLDELARLSQEFGGYEELREPGNAEVVGAIRALPDEEPPSGYVERAEVRRCEVAVVEAAEWVAVVCRNRIRAGADLVPSEYRLLERVDALRAAREKAGA